MKLIRRAEVLLALLEEPRHVRELLSELGGSASTLETCIRELKREKLIQDEQLETWPLRRVLKLTAEGREAAERLKLEGSYFGMVRKRRALGPIGERGKWILAVLRGVGGEIKGSVRLEKLLFLLKHEYGAELPYKFAPWVHGPFSSAAHEDAIGLEKSGLVEIRREEFEPAEQMSEWAIRDLYKDSVPKGRRIKLTSKGERTSEKIYGKLPEKVKDAISKLKDFNEMKLTDLLNYVYKKYPKESTGK